MTTRVFGIPMSLRFRGQTAREGVLLRGPAGWGEFSPFPEYGPAECARWLACAREAAFEGWPDPVRSTIPVNATIPAVPAARAFELAKASGCGTAKIKVAERGQDFAADLARVEAVRDALGPDGKIRVDANGGWDVDEAVLRLKELDRFTLEYAEQPCPSLDELAQVRRRVDVPIAADESIRKAEDPLRVRAAEAADIAVVKVQPLGGVRAALRVVEACGLPAVVSSAVETSVGLAAGLALAAALPELPYACGLGTMSLLTGDVVADSLTPVAGAIAVRRPEVDEAALARFEIESPEWVRRMEEAAACLAR
ncbi:o-succinylbenzoate synthase [Acrocarpospora macrocephala]|uniref:o-succinylbenzoate synthase n=1 Tax=Acrocarpospora macrocephala TaxID=150177 RepID=A0A5M3WSQ7_9ACTN|nr:o-succinylbenzoate synthase [Acrocarpospora macrocephala]GES12395.1 o-succinylbenzoate synthase [Acrocarpospora macrocephala]